MKSIIIKKNLLNLTIVFLIIFASFIRIYNINYNDLWSDEMVSFWLSDPTIPLDETLSRIFSSNWMVFYEITLKYFHLAFGYDVHISRYFSYCVSILSLIAFTFLLKKITSKESLLLGLFILSINIFHIKYSIELRSYIFAFLLTIIFIYLNFNKKNLQNKKNTYRSFGILLLALITLFCHPYTILVIGSFIVFKLLEFVKNKKINYQDFFLVSGLSVVIILFLSIYFYTTLSIIDKDALQGFSPVWLEQVKPSFYTNFYFSKFFGSRILGLIYLTILIFCIIKFRNNLIKNFNIYTFFVILLFNSYFIPLVYGYLFTPILFDRFIFFVLIPIICLLSHFILLIKSKILRYTFVTLICLTTFFNHLFFENTFKQFYSNIYPTKPEVRKALKYINNSKIKFFTFKMDDKNFINTNNIYENYLLKYLDKLNYKLEYLNYKKNNNVPDEIWIIYFKDITELEFKIPKDLDVFKIKEKIKLNRLVLVLLAK